VRRPSGVGDDERREIEIETEGFWLGAENHRASA
jgi:hypothetical protein